MKKLFRIFILVALISSLFAIDGLAIEYTDIKNEEQALALDILSAYNIIKGYPDGTFKPGNCVTRAEVAKIAINLIGYDEYTKEMTSNFTDMSGHWAERYIEVVNAMGILQGYEDNTFRPDSYITYTETVVAMLKILGYDDLVLNEDYPNNYHSLAKKLGLLKNINNPIVYMTRESLLTLIYNSLYVNTVNVKDGSITYTNRQLINNIGSKKTENIDDKFALEHIYMDLSDYMLNTCDVYYDVLGKIVLIKNPVYSTIDGHVKSSLSTNIVFLSDRLGNTKLYNLSDVPIVYNGAKSVVANEELKNSDIKLILDNTDPSIIVGAVATKVTDVKLIDSDDLYKLGSQTFAGKYLPKDKDSILYERIKIIGAVDSLDDIKADDVVCFYETREPNEEKSLLSIKVVRNTITGIYNGKVDINYENHFKIDSTDYKLASNFVATDTLSVGDKVNAILDDNGSIVKVSVEKYNKEPETYGLLLSVNQGTSELPTVKVLSQNAKIATYNLRENCGEVTKATIDGDTIYYTKLEKNSFIKYDKYNTTDIKIARNIQSVNVASNYVQSSGTLSSTNSIINSNTIIIQLNNSKYDLINKSSLGYYVEGKAVINESGVVEIFYVEKNVIKTDVNSSIVEEKSTIATFSGSLYGVISTLGTYNGLDTIKLYGYNDTYSFSKNLNKSASSFKNKFVKVSIDSNIVTDIISFTPEITKSKVSAVYSGSGQLQIDGITYIEYSNNAKVYICTQDASGNVTSFKNASISDVKVGSTAQFYNTNKSYSGVMDVIVVFN